MKAKSNCWVDVCIAATFALSAASGLVFLLPASAGSKVLGLSFAAWDSLHVWSSLGLMAGVLAHLLLHAKWIASMTRRAVLPPRVRAAAAAASCSSSGSTVTRRRFLTGAVAATVAAVTGTAAIGAAALDSRYAAEDALADSSAEAQDAALAQLQPTEAAPAALPGSEVAADEASEPTAGELDEAATSVPEAETAPEPTAQAEGPVACPKGLVYDPYPGRCRRYVDRDGDGYCDYSIPGSGAS